MATYTDDEGTEVEVDFTPEQVEEMKKQVEEGSKKEEELAKSIEEKEAELQKFRDKDLNFSKFREKTEEEKKEFEEKLQGNTKVIYEELKILRDEREAEKSKRFEAAKDNILKNLAGDDKDLRVSIEARAGDFVGDVSTEQDLEKRFTDAYTLVQNKAPQVNPLYTYGPVGGFKEPDGKAPDFVKTQRGKETYKALFGNDPIDPNEI